jgi:hypothetical protein
MLFFKDIHRLLSGTSPFFRVPTPFTALLGGTVKTALKLYSLKTSRVSWMVAILVKRGVAQLATNRLSR